MLILHSYSRHRKLLRVQGLKYFFIEACIFDHWKICSTFYKQNSPNFIECRLSKALFLLTMTCKMMPNNKDLQLGSQMVVSATVLTILYTQETTKQMFLLTIQDFNILEYRCNSIKMKFCMLF